MKFLDDAKLKMGVFLRERKERIDERRAQQRRRTAEHGAPLLWIWFLIGIAVATLIGSTWMLLVFIAGSVGHVDWAFDWRAGNDGAPGRWNWFAEANIHAIYGGGLLLFCLGIAAFNAVWLHIRHYVHGLFRNVTTGIGIAIALFMVSGAIVTQQWGTDARTRDQVIATNTAQAGVAAVNAEIDAIETEMARLCAPNLTTYQAQACRSGEAAWAERTETARQQRDYQLAGIERAMADARQGDRWRARLLELRQQAAVASVRTVEAEAATVTATGFMGEFTRFLEEIRKPFIAVLGELLAMTMFGVALAAWRSRVPATDVMRSGWADESHRIPDLREEEPIQQGQFQMQTVMEEENVETGEKKRMITPKPYWRTVKKGKKERIEVPPEVAADEVGVETDGGGRTASVEQVGPEEQEPLNEPVSSEDHPAEGGEHHDRLEHNASTQDQSSETQDLPELTEEELETLPEFSAVEEPAENAERDDRVEDEATEEHVHHEPRTEPETDERRMITVAAE